MPRSIKALIKPELLIWARKAAGLDETTAARRVGQPEERLKAWEVGDEQPTIAQLRRAAEVYKRPLAIFYLPAPPRDFAPLRDFRRLPERTRAAYSPKLLYLIRSVRERQEWTVEMRREMKASRIRFVGSADANAEIPRLATRLRNLLQVSLDEQCRWRDTDEALRQWIRRCEHVGVFVFQSSDVDPLEMRGFALPDPIAPVLLINSKDTRSARIFTLMHEFAHLALGSEGVSNLNLPETPTTPEQKIEVFCNALAAETLVPARSLRSQLESFTDWRDDVDTSVSALARSYAVSREVIARRLTDAGFTTREFYEQKRDELKDEFERYSSSRRKQKFRVPHARIILRNNGRAFARLVLSAYGENLITGRDVSSLLNMKLKHYARIEAEIFPHKVRTRTGR